mmetsp:Transcript_18711/g.41841  ORF Transcript_18711/g.41841 Transcript_18711/m.41841 type:complete len:220 (+) Transcript_18711:198-857(+)
MPPQPSVSASPPTGPQPDHNRLCCFTPSPPPRARYTSLPLHQVNTTSAAAAAHRYQSLPILTHESHPCASPFVNREPTCRSISAHTRLITPHPADQPLTKSPPTISSRPDLISSARHTSPPPPSPPYPLSLCPSAPPSCIHPLVSTPSRPSTFTPRPRQLSSRAVGPTPVGRSAATARALSSSPAPSRADQANRCQRLRLPLCRCEGALRWPRKTYRKT